MFINISKSFIKKERRYRVNSILNPVYYIQFDFKKGKDTQRHIGWKFDISYKLQFDKISKWQNMLSSLPYKKWILMSNYLMVFFTRKPYYSLHTIHADRLTPEQETEVKKICTDYNIDQDTILMAAIEIDMVLKSYFTYRMKVHHPVGYIRPKNIIYCDIYVYCKCDLQRNKMRFLIGEDYILKHNYDAPLLALRYEATPNNPLLANIIYRLKDNQYEEVLYRWMEDILESHCTMTLIDGNHFLHQKKLDDIIISHLKTPFIMQNLSEEQFIIVKGIIGQVSKYLKKAFNKLQTHKEVLRYSDTLEDTEVVKNPTKMLFFTITSSKN